MTDEKTLQAGIDAAIKTMWEDEESELRDTWRKEHTPMFAAFAEAYESHRQPDDGELVERVARVLFDDGARQSQYTGIWEKLPERITNNWKRIARLAIAAIALPQTYAGDASNGNIEGGHVQHVGHATSLAPNQPAEQPNVINKAAHDIVWPLVKKKFLRIGYVLNDDESGHLTSLVLHTYNKAIAAMPQPELDENKLFNIIEKVVLDCYNRRWSSVSTTLVVIETIRPYLKPGTHTTGDTAEKI